MQLNGIPALSAQTSICGSSQVNACPALIASRTSFARTLYASGRRRKRQLFLPARQGPDRSHVPATHRLTLVCGPSLPLCSLSAPQGNSRICSRRLASLTLMVHPTLSFNQHEHCGDLGGIFLRHVHLSHPRRGGTGSSQRRRDFVSAIETKLQILAIWGWVFIGFPSHRTRVWSSRLMDGRWLRLPSTTTLPRVCDETMLAYSNSQKNSHPCSFGACMPKHQKPP